MSIINNSINLTQPIVDTAIADSVNPIQNKAVHTYTTNNANLVTTAKSIVGAINENAEKIGALSGVVNIKVVSVLPVSPEDKTIYYVGASAPYTIKLYTTSGGYTDLGTTSVDMSQYVQKSDIVDNLTSTASDKPLSANQGKVLNDGKVNVSDIKDNLTSDDTNKPLSAKQGKVLKGLIDAIACPLPVGSIYISVGNTNPSTYWDGTTWSKLSDGKFLMSDSNGGKTPVSAELPNIRGSFDSTAFQVDGNYPIIQNPQGGFVSSIISITDAGLNYQSAPARNKTRFSLDASQSNSTYKDGGGVIPTGTIKVVMWERTA